MQGSKFKPKITCKPCLSSSSLSIMLVVDFVSSSGLFPFERTLNRRGKGGATDDYLFGKPRRAFAMELLSQLAIRNLIVCSGKGPHFRG